MESPEPKTTVQSSEVLKPGYKVLFPPPSFLTGFAYDKNPELPGARISTDLLVAIMAEYTAIYETLVQLVGAENLIVMENELVFIRNGKVVCEQMPEDIRAVFGTVPFPFFESFWRCWPKNAFVTIEDQVYLAKGSLVEAFLGEQPEYWVIGNGGMVDYDAGVALITETTSAEEIQLLAQRDIKVIALPPVDPTKQRYEFRENDIDGHCRLIHTKTGITKLYAAQSYVLQERGLQREITARARACGVQLEVIDDRRTPPLALNFIKLHFGHVIVTGPVNNILAQKLRNDLGPKRVHTTPITLTLIPSRATGSLGCMTNILPPGVLPI